MPCSVLDTWREARTLARVTLVAPLCVTVSCRVLCPGDTVVLRGTTLVSTPRCACSTTGWSKPWPATKSSPTCNNYHYLNRHTSDLQYYIFSSCIIKSFRLH